MMRKLLLALAFILMLCGCQNKWYENKVAVYYAVDSVKLNKSIDRVMIEAPKMELGNLCRFLLTNMAEVQPEQNYVAPLDKDVKVLNLTIEDTTAHILFSSAYDQMSGDETARSEACITMTLCGLDGIDDVLISSVNDLKGKRYSADDFIISPETFQLTEKNVKLYFPTEKNNFLFSESRSILVSDESEMCSMIVQELIRGYENPYGQLTTFVAPGTKLISSRVQSGICYVDITKEYLFMPRSNKDGYKLTLYAVVNSLTELPEVEKVQFLIDGKIIKSYLHPNFNMPISPIYDLCE